MRTTVQCACVKHLWPCVHLYNSLSLPFHSPAFIKSSSIVLLLLTAALECVRGKPIAYRPASWCIHTMGNVLILKAPFTICWLNTELFIALYDQTHRTLDNLQPTKAKTASNECTFWFINPIFFCKAKKWWATSCRHERESPELIMILNEWYYRAALCVTTVNGRVSWCWEHH